MWQIFKKFGPRTEKVLIEAQKIASKYNCQLQTDCIILALVSDHKTIAGDLLRHNQITKERLIEFLENDSDETELKTILKEAANLAYKYKSFYIEPEFILLSIFKHPELSGHKLLTKCQVDLKIIDNQLQEWMTGISDLNEQDELLNDLFENNVSLPVQKTGLNLKPASNTVSFLDSFSRNLTLQAAKNQLDPICGRDNEIQLLCRILLRRSKNNPVIIGEPGVGKTALVEGLAQSIVNKNVPEKLLNKQLLALDLTRLIAGTVYRGQFEERIQTIIDEAKNNKNIILFIDELHTMIGAGNSQGALDLAQILKPTLALGQLAVIGATTYEEYRQYIEKDRALSRRFSAVVLDETDRVQTLKILKKLKPGYEQFHQVRISSESLISVINLAERFIPERFFPDKAIDLLDEACSSVLPLYQPNDDLEKIKTNLQIVSQNKLQAIDQNNYPLARKYKNEEDSFHQQLAALNSQTQKNALIKPLITTQTIQQIISEKTGINLSTENLTRLNYVPANLKSILNQKIKGQKEAIQILANRLQEANFRQNNRGPLCSFIFIGPTGVGKTETARVLAKEIFGSQRSLLKFDMSEFSERHTTSFLIGAPAGYVGFEEGGKLTNAVRLKPYSVVLFDEIEKAHSDVFNLLLQILEDGYLTDNIGRKVNFTHTVVILTSNLANDLMPSLEGQIGFRSGSVNQQTKKQEVAEIYKRELNDFLSPEILGRLTEIVIFQPLSNLAIKQIIKRELADLVKQLKIRNLILNISDQAINQLIKKIDQKEGARSIRKVINQSLLRVLIDFLKKNPDKKQIKASFQHNAWHFD